MKSQIKLKFFLLLLVLLKINQSNCYAQVNTLDDKNALLFWMKVNNYSLDDQFFRSYLEITKGREYKLYQNDEFGYSKFYNNSKTEYSNDLKNIDFTKRFVISKIIDIGGYNFQRKSFPLVIDYTEYFGQLNPTNRLPYSYKNISAEVFNSSYIQKELKMSEVNAEALIQKRKTSDGQVNRKFLSKIEYSIMNLPSQTDPNNLVLYIHNITIYDGSGILSVITPHEDYYDKVNGLKLKDGTEKIFFDINWKELQKEDSLGASFYRIINYKEGKIYNPVIDYYISGKPQMIGYYPINLITKNGLFQWFYDNGQISQQVNYNYGMMNGLYQSWYSNGNKKEEVNYIFNKKNGCDYMWAEDGRCLEHGLIAEWAYTDKYFSYLENGRVIDYSKACPCFKRNDQNTPGLKEGSTTVPSSSTNLSISSRIEVSQGNNSSSINNRSSNIKPNFGVVKIDSISYKTVIIGKQTWMVENLKTTKYNNGTEIPMIEGRKAWSVLTSPAYCWYNNDIKNKDAYGALYNWYTVNSGKLCPIGWHIPTYNEWQMLIAFCGGEEIAGGYLKEAGLTHWKTFNSGSTNSSGFTGIPGGMRYYTGVCIFIREQGYWWSSTSIIGGPGSFYIGLNSEDYKVEKSNPGKEAGLSVRCLKD